jgi:hypothetical protein
MVENIPDFQRRLRQTVFGPSKFASLSFNAIKLQSMPWLKKDL